MLVLLRAAQADALAALRPMGRGEAGPTSPAGWTAVRTGDADALAGLGDAVLIDESEGRIVLEVRTAEGTTSWSWCPDWCEDETELGDEEQDAARRSAVANAVARAFGQPAEHGPVEALLREVLDEEELIEGLDRIVDLPAWDRRWAGRSVVLIRDGSEELRMALRLLARDGHPLRVADLDGTLAMQCAEIEGRALGEMLAESRSTGEAPVVHLWRGSGSAAGIDLLRRDHRPEREGWAPWVRDVETTAIDWDTGWRSVEEGDPRHREDLAATIVRTLAPATDSDALGRPVIRPEEDRDPMASMAAMVGIPPQVIAILDGDTDAPAMQAVKPASLVRDLWQCVREVTGVRDRAALRVPFVVLSVLGAVIVVLLGLVCLGMTAVGIAVVVTDGAFIDEPSATVEDWISVFLFALLTIVMAWNLARLVR
ncbi:hypothetical protein GCM10009793_25000 [Brachybacterium phenoliresistens]